MVTEEHRELVRMRNDADTFSKDEKGEKKTEKPRYNQIAKLKYS